MFDNPALEISPMRQIQSHEPILRMFEHHLSKKQGMSEAGF